MPKLSRLAGSTSHVLLLFIQDSSATTGAGLTGLAFNAAGLTCYYKRNTGTASVAVTLATITTLGTYASGGFREVDATGLPGFYEFHPPDAAYAAGARSVAFLLKGATNMAPVPIEVELTASDNQAAAGVPATGLNTIADAILARDVSNVEATAPGHCLGTIVLAGTQWSIAGTTWTIFRSDGSTTFTTKTLTVTAGQITGVS